MSELLEEFGRLTSLSPSGKATSSTEVLLRVMERDVAEQLRLCAIPHEFNAETLQALVPDLTAEQAKARYLEFAELSIVSGLGAELSLHSTVRAELFARWLQAERRSDFTTASRRLVRYFDATSTTAPIEHRETLAYRRMFHLLGADPPQGFAEFERLCRAARRASQWSACANLINLVHEYDIVLEPEMSAWLTYHEGKLASDLRDFDQAERLFARLIDDSMVSPDLHVKALLREGFIACARREFGLAIEAYQRALRIAKPLSEPSIKIHHILSSLGEAYRDSGDLVRAEELLQQSIVGAQGVHDLSALASAHNDLGTLYFRRREIQAAITQYEKSLAYLERTGDHFGSAQIFNNLGIVHTEIGELEMADGFYRRSLTLKKEAGDMLGQATTLLNRVRILRRQDDLPQAIELCLEAVQLFGVIKDLYGQAQARETLSRMYVARQDLESARESLTLAAALLERCHALQEAEDLRRELKELGRKLGLPWWAWLPILLFAVLLVLIVLIVLRN